MTQPAGIGEPIVIAEGVVLVLVQFHRTRDTAAMQIRKLYMKPCSSLP